MSDSRLLFSLNYYPHVEIALVKNYPRRNVVDREENINLKKKKKIYFFLIIVLRLFAIF